MPNPVAYIRRRDLRGFLKSITINPTYVFRAVCARRGHLHLGYLDSGKDCHVGDRTEVIFDDRGCVQGAFICGGRKRIILQRKGTIRSMIVKRKVTDAPMKHWRPTGAPRAYNEEDHDLFLLAGMYKDAPQDFGTGKRPGRHGRWRPWAQLCLRTCSLIRYAKVDYLVVD